jgi:hypothetical protein
LKDSWMYALQKKKHLLSSRNGIWNVLQLLCHEI